ncbi:hypothetical protein BT96DRAFT_216747 [Gymnopus androsaceus JB14]|uniref:Uncharacterized protein n=1 Tax=Gymnopus androsaceus JB14 TaxID=1447944 RepID=A0A6A4H5V4_9AGAR|nr:hypothetical protein BT96DRAFT_216747 [Gymnopus androsaceus JB14]
MTRIQNQCQPRLDFCFNRRYGFCLSFFLQIESRLVDVCLHATEAAKIMGRVGYRLFEAS